MIEKEIKELSVQNLYEKANYVPWGNIYYLVSEKTVLTVNCTNRCNAYCFFCYNSMTFMKGNDAYLEKDSDKVKRAFEFARKAGVEIVSFSGGEPTLDGFKLIGLVQLGKQYGFSKLRLHTNGSGLFSEITYQGKKDILLHHLVNVGLNELSISMASYEKRTNEKIMRLDTGNIVNMIAEDSYSNSLSIRLSCYVCKIGVYTLDQLQEYVEFGKRKGINRFIFRLADDSQYESIQKRMINYVKGFLERGYHVIFTHQKSDSYIYELFDGKSHIAFSYATEEPDLDKKVRRLILMPDGIVYTSWINQASYLFMDDKRLFLNQCLSSSSNYISEKIDKNHYPAKNFWIRKQKKLGKVQESYEIDLHIHSSVSDGKLSPCQVIDYLEKEGIKEAVFTEHNCFHDNFLQIKKYAMNKGINLPFQGVEINTVYCKEPGIPYMKFHVLVYGKNLDNSKLAEFISGVNEVKNKYLEELYEKLKRLGLVKKEFEQIFSINDKNVITRKKMYTRTLIAREIADTTGIDEMEAKEKYLPQIAEEIRYRNWLNIQDVIKLAKEEGAITVLAHPGWMRRYSENIPELTEKDLISAIIDLKRWGLDGLEVVHRQNQQRMRELLWNTALQLDMITIGGSDFHAKQGCALGINGTTKEEFDIISSFINNKK